MTAKDGGAVNMTVRYQERPGRLRIWFGVPWAGWAALMIWSFADYWTRHHEMPLDAMVILGPLFFAVFSIPGLVSASKRRYHSITIAGGRLRAGRDSLDLADIDPGSLRQDAVPSGGPSCGPSCGPSGGEAKLLGGALGVPFGMETVRLSTRFGEHYLIATMNGRAFLTALADSVPPPNTWWPEDHRAGDGMGWPGSASG